MFQTSSLGSCAVLSRCDVFCVDMAAEKKRLERLYRLVGGLNGAQCFNAIERMGCRTE